MMSTSTKHKNTQSNEQQENTSSSPKHTVTVQENISPTSWAGIEQQGFSRDDVLVLSKAWDCLPSVTRRMMFNKYISTNKTSALETLLQKSRKHAPKDLSKQYTKTLKNTWYPYNSKHANPEMMLEFGRIHGMGKADQLELDDIELKIAEFLSQDPNNPILLHDMKSAFGEIKTRFLSQPERLNKIGYSDKEILGIAHKWNKNYVSTCVSIATQIVTEEFNLVDAKLKKRKTKK